MDCNAWYFCFSDAVTNPIARFCKRGFRHVTAFTMTLNGFVLAIDPLSFGVSAQLSNEMSPADVISTMKERGHRIVVVPVVVKKKLIARGMPITCASYLAYTAGIPFMGMTPHQLFKRLKRMGGVEL